MSERVGPVLEANEIGHAIVAAIRAENSEVEVQDRGAYLRVLVPEPCAVSRAGIERVLGRPFLLPSDLELVMPSFRGTLSITDERASWTFEGAR
jgi:toluene monooxygenase system protein D